MRVNLCSFQHPHFFFFALFRFTFFTVSAQLCVQRQSVKGWEGFSTGTTAAVCRKTGKTGHVRNSSTPWRGTESHLVTVSSFWSLLIHPLLFHSLAECTHSEIVSVNHLLSPPFLSSFTVQCDPSMLKCQKMWISHLLLLH